MARRYNAGHSGSFRRLWLGLASGLAKIPNTPPGRRRWLLRSAILYGAMVLGAVLLFVLIDTLGKQLAAPQAGAPEVQGMAAVGAKPDALIHVLVALTAVLVVGRLLHVLCRRLGQPPVIGEVVAGILLGPSLLGQVWPEAAAFVLPPSVAPYLGPLAQLGVILYMFLVGLELNPGALRQRAHATMAISHASIIVPFLLGTVLALLLYPRFSSRDVSFTSFALFLGVATSITAFPVLARILTDRQMQQTGLGVMALGCAAINDVTAWCLLALVVGVAQAKVGTALLVVGLALAYIALMVLVVRPLASRFLAPNASVATLPGKSSEHLPLANAALANGEGWEPSPAGERPGLSQPVVAWVFAALLLSALATEAIGVHAIFGAFLLGVIIPHESVIARTLPRKLEELVTVLLLPAFFAFTGMRTQIGLISGREQWLMCGLIILVASAGKFGGTFVAARLSGLGWGDAAALGILMNTRGLMELIALNIGLDMRIISPPLFSMLVLMALVTTVATTPLLQLLTPRQHPPHAPPRALAGASSRCS